jgi:hypothetical protein
VRKLFESIRYHQSSLRRRRQVWLIIRLSTRERKINLSGLTVGSSGLISTSLQRGEKEGNKMLAQLNLVRSPEGCEIDYSNVIALMRSIGAATQL